MRGVLALLLALAGCQSEPHLILDGGPPIDGGSLDANGCAFGLVESIDPGPVPRRVYLTSDGQDRLLVEEVDLPSPDAIASVYVREIGSGRWSPSTVTMSSPSTG